MSPGLLKEMANLSRRGTDALSFRVLADKTNDLIARALIDEEDEVVHPFSESHVEEVHLHISP